MTPQRESRNGKAGMKNKNKDAFWKRERGMALNIGEVAEVSGYSRGEIGRQISHLLIGGKG